MLTIRSVLLGALFSAAAILPVAEAQTKVYPYPGDQTWYPVDRFWDVIDPLDYRAEITGANPFNGNGSLALSTTGDLWDWGFYATLSGRDPWGSLANVSGVGMWWQRDVVPQTNPNPNDFPNWPDAPWLAQTPVLRLLLGDKSGLLFGELVWEKYYNEASGYTTPYGTWQEENLFGQNFWHTASWGARYYVNSRCEPVDITELPPPPGQEDPATPPPVWNGGLLLGTPTGWASGTFADLGATGACQVRGFSLADAYVFGIAVGVGSNWPDAYQGYVDHVRLSFYPEDGNGGLGEDGQYDAVYANFELPMTPVPEPGTIALLATGLLGLGGAQLLRRRNRKS